MRITLTLNPDLAAKSRRALTVLGLDNVPVSIATRILLARGICSVTDDAADSEVMRRRRRITSPGARKQTRPGAKGEV